FESLPSWDPANLEIRLSINQIWGDGDDVNLGTFGQDEFLSSGDQILFESDINLPFNTPAGNYFVLVRFDSSFLADEFTFSNNSETVGPGFVIVRAPNLVIQSQQTFSPSYPYRPEMSSYIRYAVANTGLGTITQNQPFDIQLQLMAVERGAQDLEDRVLIRSYNSLPQSLFLPEASAQFPNGSSSNVTHFVEIPPMRDILVAIEEVEPGTPEDEAVVFAKQFFLLNYMFFFQITVDSSNSIQESSETNTFLIFTPRSDDEPDQGTLFFDIVPVNNFYIDAEGIESFTGLENYGTYSGNFSFSNFTISNTNPLTDPFGNTDGDQYLNIFEYALATNPTAASELFLRQQQNGVVKLNIPPFGDDDFLSITFDFNVRMTDLNLQVQASDDAITWDTILEIDPPFLATSGPQSLTGFGGLVSNPRVLSVDGNVTDVQKVYSARVTVRDVVPFAGVGSRFMRIQLVPEANTPPPEPTNIGVGLADEGDGVEITWEGVAKDAGADIDGAFQIERSNQANANYRLIGTTTFTDNNGVARYIDDTVQSNRTYYYRVRAVSVAGVTDYALNPESGNRFVSITLVSGN
ncbi:MAG: hypothetical protein ACQKBV_11070, partial [Puniceicoccales bacterium]